MLGKASNSGASKKDLSSTRGKRTAIVLGHEPVTKKRNKVVSKAVACSNIVRLCQATQLGFQNEKKLRQALIAPCVRELESFRIQKKWPPFFKRRVTCIRWHPSNHQMLTASSHGGDIVLLNTENDTMEFSEGIGAGGSITEMKYNADNHCQVYTSSVCGQLALRDLKNQTTKVFLDTLDLSKWYCTVDVTPCKRLIFAGDNRGYGVLLDKDGKQLFRLRMHRNKCHHGEFNLRCDWLLATSSNDHTVKLWDVRKLYLDQDSTKVSKGALYILEHNAPVNSASFSPCDGNRILTTSQDCRLSLFEGPNWSQSKYSVTHPHRHFQHLTPIKATWHPFQDLFIIGQFPNSKEVSENPWESKKTIDAFDGKNGELKCRIFDSDNGIMAVNEFSPRGDMIATGTGARVLVWTPENLCNANPPQLINNPKTKMKLKRFYKA